MSSFCRRIFRVACSTGIVAALTAPLAAQWPQWRGPGGLGISDEKNLPTEWATASPDAPAKNIVWTTEIPGRGHSSPIVWRDRVFLTTSIREAQVPGRKAPVHLGFDRIKVAESPVGSQTLGETRVAQARLKP